ncbi:hypothetical protein IEQ34_015428 [Dendrobium chrysotoxum]|uniref:Peptidyl-prolyl cis-trans isomerase n=1 Tax=Dendrobium chrysotoxum TaxID=161865 RepID=A0AAV7GG60_DENCH|nr:hypothetical protein IEQ34_015428 [Dendrobium chrysotoxum]
MLRKTLVALLALAFVCLLISISRRRVQEDKDVERVLEITHRVYLDVDIDGQHAGRIIIGLYGEVVPKTVGEKGRGGHGKALHYKGTPFHRIVSGFVIQGGDITYGDGRGGESIYGGTFPDENFIIKHSHAGVVSMVNSGPDTNGSQFFITSVKASWLDGEHVAFGKVLQGMDTVYAIEGGAGTYNGKPRKKVIIVDSDLVDLFNREIARQIKVIVDYLDRNFGKS